jgi:hypothetical protein
MQMPKVVWISVRKNLATTLGFLIAPLIAAIALLALGAANSGLDLFDMSAFVWGAIFYCYTCGATLIMGLPAYLLLRHFDKVTWWSAVLVGIFIGAVMTFIFRPLNLSMSVIGGLSGFVFWLIWRTGGSPRRAQ